MANWYYVISPVSNLNTSSRGQVEQAGDPLEIILRDAPDKAAGRGDASSLVGTIKRIHQTPLYKLQSPPASELVASKPIGPPQRLQLIRTLREQAKRETAPAHRKALKGDIRLLQNTFEYQGAGLEKFDDLQGTPIGWIHADETSSRNFPLGDTQYFTGFRFDFVKGFNGQEAGENQEIYIRTTAYMAKVGMKKAEKYILKSILNESLTPRRHRQYSITKNKAKLRMKGINSYDRTIEGCNTHINLNGKIEIYTPCPEDIFSLLTGNVRRGISVKPMEMFRQYTRYTKLKQWIGTTNQNVNDTIGATFRNLATVLAEIIPGYQ